MNLFKQSANLALAFIVIVMMAAPITAKFGWSVFAQATVFSVGLLLAALGCRPLWAGIQLALFYSGCIFLLALLDSYGRARVLSVWLYGGFVFVHWTQLHGVRDCSCWRYLRHYFNKGAKTMNRYASSFLLALTFALLWPSATLAQTQPNVVGRWAGHIEIEAMKLGISVEFALKEGSAWTGTITIPAQMLKDAPLANVSVKDNALSFELSDIPGHPTFKGNFAEDGKRISGELTQSGQTFSFKLERPGAKAAADSYVATPEKGAPGQGLEGRWQGTLDAGGSVLRVVLKVTKAADGDFTARLDSPDQGVSDLPIDGLTLKDGALRVELKRLNAGYTGTLSKDGAEIGGEWQQGGATWPLTFKRLGGKAER